jgi:hypothetical protein
MKAIFIFIFGIFGFCFFNQARCEEFCSAPSNPEDDPLRVYLQMRDASETDFCTGVRLSIATVNLAFNLNGSEDVPEGLLFDIATTQMLATEAVGGFPYTVQFIPWGDWSYTIEDLDARFYELAHQDIQSGKTGGFCDVVSSARYLAAIPLGKIPPYEAVVMGMWKHLSSDFVSSDEILTLCRHYF